MLDFIISAGTIIHVAFALAGMGLIAFAMRKKLGGFCKRPSGFMVTAFLASLVVYAAVKDYTTHTSSDANIELYGFSAEPIKQVIDSSITNIIGVTYLIQTSVASDAPQPIWWRQKSSDPWTNFGETNGWSTTAPVLYKTDGGTNYYQWVNTQITNDFDHAQWYIGTELPNIIIDVDDEDILQITEWSQTAKNMRIKFTVADSFEYPEGTVIQIRRADNTNSYTAMSERFGEYELVDTIPVVASGTYTWNGFSVGRSTKWSLRITIIEED